MEESRFRNQGLRKEGGMILVITCADPESWIARDIDPTQSSLSHKGEALGHTTESTSSSLHFSHS